MPNSRDGGVTILLRGRSVCEVYGSRAACGKQWERETGSEPASNIDLGKVALYQLSYSRSQAKLRFSLDGLALPKPYGSRVAAQFECWAGLTGTGVVGSLVLRSGRRTDGHQRHVKPLLNLSVLHMRKELRGNVLLCVDGGRVYGSARLRFRFAAIRNRIDNFDVEPLTRQGVEYQWTNRARPFFSSGSLGSARNSESPPRTRQFFSVSSNFVRDS